MSEYINPHPTDPELRYVVTSNTGFWDITDIVGDEFGIKTLRAPRNIIHFDTAPYNGSKLDLPSDTISKLAEVSDTVFKRCMRALGYDAYRRTVSGYSQSEWSTIAVYAPIGEHDSRLLEAVASDVDLWFKGEVYTLELQKRKVYTAEDGSTITQWETVDSIGGYLTDDPETLHQFGDL